MLQHDRVVDQPCQEQGSGLDPREFPTIGCTWSTHTRPGSACPPHPQYHIPHPAPWPCTPVCTPPGSLPGQSQASHSTTTPCNTTAAWPCLLDTPNPPYMAQYIYYRLKSSKPNQGRSHTGCHDPSRLQRGSKRRKNSSEPPELGAGNETGQMQSGENAILRRPAGRQEDPAPLLVGGLTVNAPPDISIFKCWYHLAQGCHS